MEKEEEGWTPAEFTTLPGKKEGASEEILSSHLKGIFVDWEHLKGGSYEGLMANATDGWRREGLCDWTGQAPAHWSVFSGSGTLGHSAFTINPQLQ